VLRRVRVGVHESVYLRYPKKAPCIVLLEKASCLVTARWASPYLAVTCSLDGRPKPPHQRGTWRGTRARTPTRAATREAQHPPPRHVFSPPDLCDLLPPSPTVKFIIRFRPPLGSRRAPAANPIHLLSRICTERPADPRPDPRARRARPFPAPIPVPAARNRPRPLFHFR
jgi:hypothetical protein